MLSRLTILSLRSTATVLHGPLSILAIDHFDSRPLTPFASSEPTKCPSESPTSRDIRSFTSSSIDAEESHDDASEDESEGEGQDTVTSDDLDPKTKEQYVVKEARKRLATEGAAPKSEKAFSALESHLLSRSRIPKSMSSLSVSLFNFHTPEFAQRLLDKSVGNLVMVESALEHAMKAKDFCRAVRRQGRRAEAFHADAVALFGLDRKKKEPPAQRYGRKKKPPLYSFPDQLVARPKENDEDGTVRPLRLRRKDSRPLTTVISPIIICPLGVHTQQAAVLDAFLRSLLQHHLNIDEKGLFTLGDVELITYLHSEQASHLLASSDPSLAFVSHANRRRSQLMHTLFEIGKLPNNLRFDSFSPHNIPPSKKMAHAKKMKEAGFPSSRWFGCWLRPRSTVLIGGREVVPGVAEEEHDSLTGEEITPTLPSSDLLPYTVWCEALGKIPSTKKAADALNILIPGSSSKVRSIVPDGEKIGDVTVEDADAIFIEALPELRESPNVQQYREKHLMKSDDKVKFAD